MESIIAEVLSTVGTFLSYTWWFWLFLILKPVAEDMWLFWRQERYKKNLPWFTVEMRIPRETHKSPRAMEQALMAIHQLRNSAGNLQEKYVDGEVTHWLCLEIVSFGGEVRFFIRGDAKKRDLIEAPLFSYYPDVELVDVDDYVDRFPENVEEMHRQGYDMFGTELVLKKDPAYPIKSYTEFIDSPEEEQQYDPISSFLEVLSKAKPQEMVGIQFLLSPAADDWKEHGQHVVEKLSEMKKSGGHKKSGGMAIHFPGGPLPVFEGKHEEKKPDDPIKSLLRSPGQTDTLKAVENNLSKPAFETLIRLIYFSPKAIYYDSYPRRGLLGAFNQYGSYDLNSFVQNMSVQTRTQIWSKPYIFPKIRGEYKKQRMIYNYRRRKLPAKTFIAKLMTSHLFNWNFASKKIYLNVESIATLYHPPTHIVLTGPHVQRSESKKAGPPAGLAIFGGNEELDRYQ